MRRHHSLVIEIAGLGFELRAEPATIALLAERLRFFRGTRADYRLSIDPSLPATSWRVAAPQVERRGEQLFITCGGATRVELSLAGREGQVRFSASGGGPRHNASFALNSALRALCATLLPRRGWLLLHASAVELGGAGIAFVGKSGAGKTTISSLAGGRLLSDELLAVCLDDGAPRLHATPFSTPPPRRCRSRAAPLCFGAQLHQAPVERAAPLTPGEALGSLLGCVAVPEGDPEAEERAFVLAERLSRVAPWYRLEFSLSQRGVRKVLAGIVGGRA